MGRSANDHTGVSTKTFMRLLSFRTSVRCAVKNLGEAREPSCPLRCKDRVRSVHIPITPGRKDAMDDRIP